MHTTVYSLIMLIMTLPIFLTWSLPLNWCLFVIVTFFCHTIQDYITSRENAILAKLESKHKFFVSIGFDQFLHFVQLILTYYYLINLKF